jgi:tripartite-type tricarboxylate transporter receptor subunit TctC
VAPAATPDAIVDKLNAAFVQALRDPAVEKQIIEQGAEPITNTPTEFSAFIASEIERFGKVVRSVGIKGE